MREPADTPENPLLLPLLLFVGVFALAQHAKLPHWLFFGLMLAVLAGSRRLAPEWFADGWFDGFWRLCVAVAAGGLLLDSGARLVG